MLDHNYELVRSVDADTPEDALDDFASRPLSFITTDPRDTTIGDVIMIDTDMYVVAVDGIDELYPSENNQ